MPQFLHNAPADRIAAALRALSRDMDDPYALDDATLALALQGDTRAVLALEADTPVGVALWSPFVSTTRGRIGAFVTDLWVHRDQRGSGLGRSLLRAVREAAQARWGATFLRLNHAVDNPAAAAFYARLGFQPNPKDLWLTLESEALERL